MPKNKKINTEEEAETFASALNEKLIKPETEFLSKCGLNKYKFINV